MAYTLESTSAASSLVSRAVTSITDMLVRFDQYRQYTRTLNELSALGDRELLDLGLNRGMLDRVARQAANLD